LNRLQILCSSSAVLLASLLAVPFTGTARADALGGACSPSDMVNAVKNSVSDGVGFLQNHSKCTKYFSDNVFWVISGGLTVATLESPEIKNQCLAIEDLNDKKIPEAQKKLTSLHGQLGNVVPKEYMDKLDAELGDLAKESIDPQEVLEYLNYISCACAVATESGGAEFTQFAGNCLVDVMCEFDEWMYGEDHCSGPLPMELVDCAQPPPKGTGLSACLITCTEGRSGFCSEGEDPNIGGCASAGFRGRACFCPPPMQMGENKPSIQGWCGEDVNVDCQFCECPSGTHRAGNDPVLARICLCKDGQLVGKDGKCPSPKSCNCACPSNQVLISKSDAPCSCNCGCPEGQVLNGDKCGAPTCAAGNVRLPDGSCCLADQVTSCGICCPSGQKPEVGGSCVSSLSFTPVLLKPKAPQPPQ